MIAWRVVRAPFADLTGTGARLNGGRWNSPGLAALYLSEHPALCMLEFMVNLGVKPKTLPIDLVIMTIVVPDTLPTEDAPLGLLLGTEFVFGDAWLKAQRSPVLWVPSVVMPQSFNIVVNPDHPASATLTVRDVSPLRIDPRLFR